MAIGIVLVLIALAVIGILLYLKHKRTHVATDDAFVDGHIHIIAAKVAGTIQAIHVEDNQSAAAGTLLLELDPRDYAARLAEAQAAAAIERARLPEVTNQVEAARRQWAAAVAVLQAGRSNVDLQRANLAQAELDLQRAESLWKGGAAPRENYDRARTARDVTQAQLRAAESQVVQLEAAVEAQRAVVAQSEAAVPTQQAAIRQKEAAAQTAELNLSYTRIIAPIHGQVTRRSAEVGNQVQAGQPLLSLVPLDPDAIWITANYKETQLTRVRPGQRVRMKIDAYPDLKLTGRVQSLMAGSGSAFSLFPPENATGNYVKVVQRVPVKIVIDSGLDADRPLRVGMSVAPTILVEQ